MKIMPPLRAFLLWLCRRAAVGGAVVRHSWLVLWGLCGHRVPVLLQLNEVECAAACLAMVLTYYGRPTRVAECRHHCSPGRDGVTARTIAAAARAFGLRVRAFSLSPEAMVQVPLPAVAHWEFNHFVVVERWSSQRVDIVDPAVGRRPLTSAEFDTGFTGVLLTMEPGAHFQRRPTTARPSWGAYLLARVSAPGARGVLIQVLVASVLLVLISVTVPILTGVLVDHVLPFELRDVMPLIGASIVLIVLMQCVIAYLRATLLVYLEGQMDKQLMLGFFEHLLTLPLPFFEHRSSGDLLLRLRSNTIIRELLTGETIAFVLDGTLVCGLLVVLLVRDLAFGLLAFGIGTLQVLVLIGTTRRIHGLVQRHLYAQAESQSYLVEALQGMATLKASGTEPRALEHWTNLFLTELRLSLERSYVSALVETLLSTLRMLSPLALLWVGATRVLAGEMSLGTMLALNALATTFLTPLASLVSSAQRLQLVGAHLERLADVLEAEPEQGLGPQLTELDLIGTIELRDVSFRYDPQAPLVLHDITLTIPPGAKVALVGATGSGKSTLARVLLGLYRPEAGTISYGGVPLERLDYHALRSRFGVVLQEPFLFSGSVRENIAFSDPGMPLEQVIAAARVAGIDQEIAALPMAYETRVAEGGGGLSGGQRQRLVLARAVAHGPALLVLDEATSQLDVVTERQVEENLGVLGCTRIVLAHRLSTIRDADLIVVLDRGVIVEQGTHTTLVAQNGHYAALIRGQIGGKED